MSMSVYDALSGFTQSNPNTTDPSLNMTRSGSGSGDNGDNNATHNNGGGNGNGNDDDKKKKNNAKRRKVNHACLYCRRSHMTCDEGRPCQRCIKREIGHLCHDEPRAHSLNNTSPHRPERELSAQAQGQTVNLDMARGFQPNLGTANYGSPPIPQNNPGHLQQQPQQQLSLPPQWPPQAQLPQLQDLSNPFSYNDALGHEFSFLTDVLEQLNDRSFFTAIPPPGSGPQGEDLGGVGMSAQMPQVLQSQSQSQNQPDIDPMLQNEEREGEGGQGKDETAQPVIIPSASKTERFLLTAADQEKGSRNERLNRVIRAKYEAGLLKPYNYVKGYARLSRWMDRNVSQDSKQQILQPLSVLRPKFRAVAQSLTDIHLVYIEEFFERLLLDYDRVFSSMGVPACLWRRTGEIYKGNQQFAELVGVNEYMLRDGRLCIYELMAEESAVNYWEKYGHVAFDSSQKAVLTSCVLRLKPILSTSGYNVVPATTHRNVRKPQPTQSSGPGGSSITNTGKNEEGLVNCCFSFTIRRDDWGIPIMIVGNFIKC